VLLRAVAGLVGVVVVAVPAWSSARDDVVCDSSVAAVGRCDARRPSPSIVAVPAAPHAGSPVVLTAASGGRGVTYAWDLDGDGAFDDGSGARLVRPFEAGARTVAVRATDEDGRVGSEVMTLPVHAANSPPGGRFRVAVPSPGSATTTEAFVDAADPDGHVASVEFDIHGDGEYDTLQTFAPGETAHAEHRYPDPVVGNHTTAARITDDSGATTELKFDLDVHLGNLPPRVTIAVTPSAPRPGEPVTVSASATDPDGPTPDVTFDLDGDGTYETDVAAPSIVTTLPAGVHELGAQAHDDDGDTAVSRQTVDVGAPAPEIALPAGVVRPGAAVTFGASEPVMWDMDGDGAFDDGPTHAFPEAGTFPVRARTAGGRLAMRTVTVVPDNGLAPAVTALDRPAAIAAGRPATFSAGAADPDGGPVTLTFDHDGDGSCDDYPSHVPGCSRWT
jgi:hypothetical protein